MWVSCGLEIGGESSGDIGFQGSLGCFFCKQGQSYTVAVFFLQNFEEFVINSTYYDSYLSENQVIYYCINYIYSKILTTLIGF